LLNGRNKVLIAMQNGKRQAALVKTRAGNDTEDHFSQVKPAARQIKLAKTRPVSSIKSIIRLIKTKKQRFVFPLFPALSL